MRKAFSPGGKVFALPFEMTDPTSAELMTPSPHGIRQEQPLSAGYRSMREHRNRHLPVLHGGKLVGVSSQRDPHFTTVDGMRVLSALLEQRLLEAKPA